MGLRSWLSDEGLKHVLKSLDNLDGMDMLLEMQPFTSSPVQNCANLSQQQHAEQIFCSSTALPLWILGDFGTVAVAQRCRIWLAIIYFHSGTEPWTLRLAYATATTSPRCMPALGSPRLCPRQCLHLAS